MNILVVKMGQISWPLWYPDSYLLTYTTVLEFSLLRQVLWVSIVDRFLWQLPVCDVILMLHMPVLPQKGIMHVLERVRQSMQV